MFCAASGTILHKFNKSDTLIPPFHTGIVMKNPLQSKIYFFIVLYQIATVLIAFSIDVGHDLLFTNTMLEICSQVALLEQRYRSMIKNIEKQHNSYTASNPIEKKKIEKQMISSFINNHLEIINLADKINVIFSVELFLQFLLGGLMICVLAHQLSVMEIFSPGFFSAASLLSAALSQTAIICIVSDEVKLQVDISQFIYLFFLI